MSGAESGARLSQRLSDRLVVARGSGSSAMKPLADGDHHRPGQRPRLTLESLHPPRVDFKP